MTRRPKPRPAPKRHKPPKKPWRKMKCPECGRTIWRKPYVTDVAKCHECGFNGQLIPG